VNGEGGQPADQGPRGPRGDQGARGERGPGGLSRPVRRARVYLFALSAAMGGFNLVWTAHEVDASQAAIQSAHHREQVSQKRAGATLERALCTTFGRLAALKPPPGDPKANPSRAALQDQHDTLAQLGTDLGCK
jgi:hypothetical protein